MFVNGEKIHFAKRIIFRECISGHVFTHYIECNQENDFVMQRNAYSNTVEMRIASFHSFSEKNIHSLA